MKLCVYKNNRADATRFTKHGKLARETSVETNAMCCESQLINLVNYHFAFREYAGANKGKRLGAMQ